tara:strand:+ start:2919 stop:3047 length:129 start_codon:yes stop_codon:yes gene_type:complete
MKNKHKFTMEEVKDDFWDMLKYMPPIIWYAGMFILGFIIGSW